MSRSTQQFFWRLRYRCGLF